MGFLSGLANVVTLGGYNAYQGHQDSLARKKAYIPEAPQYKQAPELFESALGFGKENFPNEFGARESALGDIATPESTTDYYSKFQPTSFEDALMNQYFANTWPGVQREIKGGLSLSGLEYSPLLSEQLGKARGDIGFNIGSYLSEQAGGRATNSLNARLEMNPRDTYEKYLEYDKFQSNLQEQADYARALDQADMDYWKALKKGRDKTQTASSVSKLLNYMTSYNYGGMPSDAENLASHTQGGQAMPVDYLNKGGTINRF